MHAPQDDNDMFFDEDGNPVSLAATQKASPGARAPLPVAGPTGQPVSPQEFDFNAARAALDELFAIPSDAENPVEPGMVMSGAQRAALGTLMPLAAYVQIENEGRVYVPAQVIDYAAWKAFGDQLTTTVVSSNVMHAAKSSLRSGKHERGNPKERNVFRVVAEAHVRVTVTAPNGKSQSHDAMGIATYDEPFETGDMGQAYRVAVKGAVTDGRRTALENFGLLFKTNARGQDELLASQQQRRALLAEIEPDAPVTSVASGRAGQPKLTQTSHAPVRTPARQERQQERAPAKTQTPAQAPARNQPAAKPQATAPARANAPVKPAQPATQPTAPAAATKPAAKMETVPEGARFPLRDAKGVTVAEFNMPKAFAEEFISILTGLESLDEVDRFKTANKTVLDALGQIKSAGVLLAAIETALDEQALLFAGDDPAAVAGTSTPATQEDSQDEDAAVDVTALVPDIEVPLDADKKLADPDKFQADFIAALQQVSTLALVDALQKRYQDKINLLKPAPKRMAVFAQVAGRKLELKGSGK